MHNKSKFTTQTWGLTGIDSRIYNALEDAQSDTKVWIDNYGRLHVPSGIIGTVTLECTAPNANNEKCTLDVNIHTYSGPSYLNCPEYNLFVDEFNDAEINAEFWACSNDVVLQDESLVIPLDSSVYSNFRVVADSNDLIMFKVGYSLGTVRESTTKFISIKIFAQEETQIGEVRISKDYGASSCTIRSELIGAVGDDIYTVTTGVEFQSGVLIYYAKNSYHKVWLETYGSTTLLNDGNTESNGSNVDLESVRFIITSYEEALGD